MAASFQYLALKTQPQEIRILNLLPGLPTDPIYCTLQHVSLASPPEYGALSYVWGTTINPDPIFLRSHEQSDAENVPVSVTANLVAALRSYRHSTIIRILWIDALCINQSSIAERSAQVGLMREIYSSASETLIYFSAETPHCGTAIKLLKALGNIDTATLPQAGISLSSRTVIGHPVYELIKSLDALEAVREFFACRWWTRVWIVQEICLARSATFSWGSWRLNWGYAAHGVFALMNLAAHICDMPDYEDETWVEIDQTSKCASAVTRAATVIGGQRKLADLLLEFWLNEATDGRDNVFALLGLSTDNHERSVVPDYGIGFSEGMVFAKAVEDLMHRMGNLDVLGFSSGVGRRRREGLPTWAADWTNEGRKARLEKDMHLFPFHLVENKMVFKSARPASERYEASGPVDISKVVFEEGGMAMRLRGFPIGTVGTLSSIRGYLFHWEELMTEWMPIAQMAGETYFTGQNIQDTYLSTLCGDLLGASAGLDEITKCISMVTSGRRFMLTGDGLFVGLVVGETRVGDIIWIVEGARTPVVLRREGTDWAFVGEAYIHGVMRGQLVGPLNDSNSGLEVVEVLVR